MTGVQTCALPICRPRSGTGRQGGSRPQSKGAPRKGGGQGQGGRPRPQQPRRSPQSSKSYAQIQALSLDERLAYYKEQYQKESGAPAVQATAERREGQQRPPKQAAKPSSKPTAERRDQIQRPSKPASKPAATQPAKAAPETDKGEKKKKGSFFSRLLGKGKK